MYTNYCPFSVVVQLPCSAMHSTAYAVVLSRLCVVSKRVKHLLKLHHLIEPPF